MVTLVIGVMLLTSAGFTLGSTGVETLFFTRYGTEYLPYMYLILGVFSFVTSLGITALLGRVRRETLYIFIPIGVAVLTIFAWVLFFSNWKQIYPVLWLGKEVINSLVSLVVWGIAGTVCDSRQSKRLFPLFNAGRILGAVIGGIATGILVKQIGTQNLLLVWTVMLLLAFVLTRTLLQGRDPDEPPKSAGARRKQKQPSLIQEMQRGYQFMRGSRLMQWVSLAAILFSVLYFSIALPFSKAITVQYPDENTLAAFLGLFNSLCTAAAFLASTLIANRLYARFGIMNALLALPVIYLLGFSGLVISDAFLVIIVFRFVQMLWMSGIADSAYQAMFNAVPSARRDQVRAFIDGIPSQAGTFIAGIILIIGEQAFSSQQLAVIGLVAAIATTYIIWRAGRAYNFALVDSLRKGRPTLFDATSRPDAAALKAALDGMKSPDPIVRRISAEVVSAHTSSTDVLIQALYDEDTAVRIFALKGLARLQDSSVLLDIASLLSAPQPELRAQAVDSLRALTPYPRGVSAMLAPLLDDEDPRVRVRAIAAILSFNPEHPSRTQLRRMSMLGETDERILALTALAEIGDPEALALFTNELNDKQAPVLVRCAAAQALGSCGEQAIPVLVTALTADQTPLKLSAAEALGKIGDASLPAVMNSLADSDSEEGALFALEHLPAWKEAERIREFIKRRIESSVRFDDLRLAIHQNKNERVQLLAESIQSCSRRDAIHALNAVGLLGDRETISIAVENLQSGQQISNALETLESIKYVTLIRPLFRVWEPVQDMQSTLSMDDALAELVNEKDIWLRACANFVKEETMETTITLSTMERVLILRRVPLLAGLSPADLQRVAGIATEQDFVDGEVICEQGETGDEMYMIVSGEVRVLVQKEGQADKEIARRTAGEIVGEMSLISGDTRNASVIALGDVRVLSINRLNFESLLRERPEVSLAVMRVLCERLKEMNLQLIQM